MNTLEINDKEKKESVVVATEELSGSQILLKGLIEEGVDTIFGYPGGANDVPEIVAFLRVLFQIGYLKADGSAPGNVSFEIKPLPGEDAGVMIAAAKRKLGEAWAQLTI